MKIIERMKNIFGASDVLPRGFTRNAEYDVALLVEMFGCVPEILNARNGRQYIYFEDMDAEKLAIVRKLGLNPRRHKSRMYKPAKTIYRAPVGFALTHPTMEMVIKMKMVYHASLYVFPEIWKRLQTDPEYLKYVQAYKSQQKTK